RLTVGWATFAFSQPFPPTMRVGVPANNGSTAANNKTPSPPSVGGEGWGEEEPWLPLSSVLSPLLRRGARKTQCVSDQFAHAAGVGIVAQIFNLPYRRLGVGRAWDRSYASAFAKDSQSATLRYGAARPSRKQRSADSLVRKSEATVEQRTDK